MIHNYGHGGDGVTLHLGCALDTVQLITMALTELGAKAKLWYGTFIDLETWLIDKKAIQKSYWFLITVHFIEIRFWENLFSFCKFLMKNMIKIEKIWQFYCHIRYQIKAYTVSNAVS